MVKKKQSSSQIFGAYLAQLRACRNLTQRHVATKLGYGTSQFISNVERGIALPPLNKLRKLASLYEIGVNELVDKMVECLDAEYNEKISAIFKMVNRS